MVDQEHLHAFGSTAGVIELGAGHYLRPLHQLVRRSEPLGQPVVADADSLVIGLAWWHTCPARPEGGWLPVESVVIACPFCGDSGRIVDGAWRRTRKRKK